MHNQLEKKKNYKQITEWVELYRDQNNKIVIIIIKSIHQKLSMDTQNKFILFLKEKKEAT